VLRLSCNRISPAFPLRYHPSRRPDPLAFRSAQATPPQSFRHSGKGYFPAGAGIARREEAMALRIAGASEPILILSVLAALVAWAAPANAGTEIGPDSLSRISPQGISAPNEDTAGRPAVRRVLLIGIDGLRADAFRLAHAPHFDSLRKDGALAGRAVTDVLARSGPGWTSVLTGVWGWKHGARNNAFDGYKADAFPTFLQRLAAERPGTVTGAVVNWKPLGSNLFGRNGFWVAPGNDRAVADEAIKLIGKGIPDVLFVHFDGVDHAGHTFGFSPWVPFYMWAVERIDGYVGELTRAVRARAGEEWLIVVTSDHGGSYRGHGENVPEDRTVFVLANGPGCRPERPEGFRGVVDVAPTVFAYLGVPVRPEWKWDGHPLGYDPIPAVPALSLTGRQHP
jgi:hypothetical protein